MLPPDRGAVRGAARAALIAEWMSQWLDRRVTCELAESYRDLAVEVEAGRTDLAWTPPAVCARLRGGSRAILSAVRDGLTGCSAMLVVRDGADVEAVQDLMGKRAAWVDPLSSSGHLMALAHLWAHGLDPDELLAEQRFAGSHRDALADVAAGRADVTSFYRVADDDDRTMAEIQELAGPRAPLRFLSQTLEAPYDALVVGEGAPPGLEEKILSLDSRSFPPAMLLEVCRVDRFAEADVDAYARFEELCERLLG